MILSYIRFYLHKIIIKTNLKLQKLLKIYKAVRKWYLNKQFRFIKCNLFRAHAHNESFIFRKYIKLYGIFHQFPKTKF